MNKSKKLNKNRRSSDSSKPTSDRAIKDFSDNLLSAMIRILAIEMRFDYGIEDESIIKLLENSRYQVETMLVVQEELVKTRLISDANLDAFTDILRTVNQNLADAM